LKTSDLDYVLPDELIARRPLAERDGARLLVLAPAGVEHRTIRELPELIPPGALVVVNDSRVIKARLLGNKRGSGGRVELLLVRRLSGAAHSAEQRWQALGRSSKPLRPGACVDFTGLEAELATAQSGGVLEVVLRASGSVDVAVEQAGRVPIPPYLGREDDAEDAHRYQTVYASEPGSVAAPTAGLHLSSAILSRFEARGIEVGKVTLHVGIGTFRPVTTDELDEHPMHAEVYSVSASLADAIARARARGAPVVAIGTTAVRALESAADEARPGQVRVETAETRLFVRPGYPFRVVDALFTNFHQPRSTLLALVSAFAGLERVRAAYAVAVAERYRFLSYGDAMFIPERSS
jgi:S-adenosylmethionine:tRNA ribosyltransferase-isomerase